MKSLLVFIVGLLIASAADANITRLQSATATGSGSTCVVTFGSATSAHDLIVVWSFWQSSTPTASVGDSQSNTWATAVGKTNRPGSAGGSAQIFFAKNISGGADTVTVTYSGSTSACNVVVVEYTGPNQNSPLDATAVATGTSSALDSGAAIPVYANELVFGAGAADAGTVSVGTGFSSVQTSGGNLTEDSIRVSNVGQQHATGSSSSSANWVMQVATFSDTSTTFSGSVGIAGPRPYVDVTAYGASGSFQSTTGTITSSSTALTLAAAEDFANSQGIAVFGAGPTSTLSAPASPSGTQVATVATIFTHDSILGTNGITCSAGVATVNTIGWHGFPNGASVTIAGNSVSNYNGTFTIASLPNTYSFTFAATCNGTGQGGTVTLNAGSKTFKYQVVAEDALSGYSAATSTFTVANAQLLSPQIHNHLTWTASSNAVQYLVYGDAGAGGALTCLGPAPAYTTPAFNPDWNDYGSASLSCPANAPTTPPASATAQILITTIVSGAGTTGLTLGTAASNSVTTGIVQHDDTAAINAATAAVAANTLVQFGGGNVLNFPTGTYYFQTWVLPIPTPTGSSPVIIQGSGQLSPRVPINVALSDYTFHGIGGGQGQQQANRTGWLIADAGLAPVFHLHGDHTELNFENLQMILCPESCVLGEADASGALTTVTFTDDSMTTQELAGHAPLRMFRTAFGYRVINGYYATMGNSQVPAIDSVDTVLFSVAGANFAGSGPSITCDSSATTYCTGVFDFTQSTDGYESGNTPLVVLSPTGTNISAVEVRGPQPADPITGQDNTLVRVNTGSTTTADILRITNAVPGAEVIETTGSLGVGAEISCAFFNSNCTGDASARSAFNGGVGYIGTFIDNQGATFFNQVSSVTNPAIHVVSNATSGNLFTIERPIGTIKSSFDINGNLMVPSATSASYLTATNCSSSASPAACGSAAAGSVSIAASSSSVVVDTTAITANSQITVTFDSSLGTKLGITCNTTAQQPYVSARTAGTSFTFSVGSNFATHPGCFSYSIVN